MFELLLAGFIMAVGLSIAGAGTYFYQWVIGQQAMLRYDGTLSLGSVLLSALVAFGWSFITGLLFLGFYFAVTGG